MTMSGPMYPALLVILALFFSVACQRHRDPQSQKDATPVVKRIRFEGNTRFKSDEILEYMQTEASSWRRGFGLAETQYLVKGRLKDDLKVIVQLYRSAGYYDAKIVDTRIEKRKATSKNVTLTIVIMEGKPILVTALQTVWQSPVNDKGRVLKRVSLREGEPADVALLTASKEDMVTALKDAGYALATVAESMNVDVEKRTATVRFAINPGPLCKVGDFSITGLKDVPLYLVQRELGAFQSSVYTPALKKEIEDKLLQMNVFGVVSVFPESHLNDNGTLNLHANLVESDPRSLKLGVGVALEPNMHKVRTTAVFSHQNLFHRLFGFQLKTQVGYAFLPAFWQVDSHGFIVLFEPSISKKGLLEKNLFWTLSASYVTDVEEDFRYLGPNAKLSVSRFFFKKTLAGLSYNFNFFYIYDATDRWIAAVNDAYAAFENPYRLGFVEAKYIIMLTDRNVDPHNGAVFGIRYAIADKSLGSIDRYNKITPSLSLYWQMIPRVQLAVRAETGLLLPFGDTGDTSYWSNYFLGGYNTMRGWGGKKLAPSVEYCLEETDCDTIRIGGRTMVLGNVELRVRTLQGLSVVTFLDVGDVQYDVMSIVPSAWNYSVGLGLRLDSPVGKVRLDVGFRINDPELYQDEPRLAVHLGLGEAF